MSYLIWWFGAKLLGRSAAHRERVRVVKDELSHRGLALAFDAFSIDRKGESSHEQGLPQGLFEDGPLGLEHERFAVGLVRSPSTGRTAKTAHL